MNAGRVGSRRRPWVVGAGLAAMVLTLVVGLPWGVATRATGLAQEPGWPCDLVSRRQVRPAVVPVDAETTITMVLAATCAPVTRPLHVAMVIDASQGMKDDLLPLQDALVATIGALKLPARPWLSIGVVSFTDQAQVERGLTNSAEQAVAGVRDVRLGDGPATPAGLQDALRKALRMLPAARPARTPEDVRRGPREVILVASGGVDPAACDRVRAQATDVQSNGVLVMTACVGASCDRQCLAEAASAVSGRRFAFRSWSSWGFLVDLLGDLVAVRGPYFAPIQRVTVVDQLHENLLYQGGGNPSRGDGQRLQWAFAPWTDMAVTRSYRARAIGWGRYLVSRSITATLDYNSAFWPQLSRTVALDNPLVEVLPPGEVTPTPRSGQTPTASPTSAATATPTSTPSASPTPTTPPPTPTMLTSTPRPTPGVVYLPRQEHLGCAFDGEWTDAVLLVDVSGSMANPAAGSSDSRWAVARALAGRFLDGLAMVDQVAVLQYGGQTEVLADLAPCCGPARAGLDRLGRIDGTRLDLAVAAAMAQLTSPAARVGTRQVVLLITDGDLNQTDFESLDGRLADAWRRGVIFFAAGVSADADRTLLARLVGSAARVFLTGDRGLDPAAWPGGPLPRCGP